MNQTTKNQQISPRETENRYTNRDYTNKSTEEVYWLKGAIVFSKQQSNLSEPSVEAIYRGGIDKKSHNSSAI
jgi:hypothetical protein